VELVKDNKRLKELKLSFYINNIDKTKDKITYSRIMKILSCLAGALGRDEHSTLAKLTMESVGGNLLNATDKEIVATTKAFFSNAKAAKLLGITNTTFYNRYAGLINRDFVTDKFLNSLRPIFNTEKDYIVIDLLIKFIENFNFDVGDEDEDIKYNERTLEIEFWLIYDKLMSIIQNATICDKFMFNICNLFEIDYNDISQLRNNVHVISRQYPHFRYSNRYFLQEIVYLYNKKGLTKCQIAKRVLNKDSNFLYIGTNKAYTKLIGSDNADWQYVPTLDWTIMDKINVMKFINLLHLFITYGYNL
jgi:hypothetical protein